jgi:alkylation response protein AidB-like acyl-CoA dehydrogenase
VTVESMVNAQIGQIYEGTSNMQLQTIAKHILAQ